MESSVLTDVATLKSALRALRLISSPEDQRHLRDIDIANLAKLVEDIVLFDGIYYPTLAIDDKDSRLPFNALGEAVHQKVISPDLYRQTTDALVMRLPAEATIVELFNVIGLIPTSFWTTLLHNTLKYLVFQGLGVKDKYSDAMKTLYLHKGIEESDLSAYGSASSTGFSSTRSGRGLDSGPLRNWDNVLAAFEKKGIPRLRFALSERGQLITGDPNQTSGYAPGFAVTLEIAELTEKLLWAHYRANFYLLLGEALGLPYTPHTLRSPLAQYALLSSQTPLPAPEAKFQELVEARLARKRILAFIEGEATNVADEIRSFYGVHQIRIPVPAIFLQVAKKAVSLEHLMVAAYELRQTRPATAFRRACAEIQEALQAGDIKPASRLMAEVKRLCAVLRAEYGVVEDDSAKLQLTIGPVKVEKAIKLPGSLSQQFFPGKARLAFLRNIFVDLAHIQELGSHYDRLFDVPRR